MPPQYPSRASVHRPARTMPSPLDVTGAPLGTHTDRRSTEPAPSAVAPRQYPTRASLHRPASTLPTPLDAVGTPPIDGARATQGTRAERRLADRAAARRRRSWRRRTVQSGSVAAVTSAILITGVTVDTAVSTADASMTDGVDEGVLVLGDRSVASRSGDREVAPLQARGADPVVAETTLAARDLAGETINRAAALVATEARVTPAQRDEVLAQSAVVLELMARSEAVVGLDTEPTDDADLSAAVDAAIGAAAESLGVAPGDAGADPEVVSYALERMAADLGAVLDSASPAVVEVAPAALTPADVLAEQEALGVADAERRTALADVTRGPSNGRLPAGALTSLSWASGQRLRPDAAAQLERLNVAFRARFGHDIAVTDSYRSFAGQVAARRTRGHLAATPGTSNHGWGVAVDLGSGINRFGTETHRWMRENAPKFGWDLPAWARQDGSKPEPWHWEFVAAPASTAD